MNKNTVHIGTTESVYPRKMDYYSRIIRIMHEVERCQIIELLHYGHYAIKHTQESQGVSILARHHQRHWKQKACAICQVNSSSQPKEPMHSHDMRRTLDEIRQEQYHNKTAQILPELNADMKLYVQLQPQLRDWKPVTIVECLDCSIFKVLLDFNEKEYIRNHRYTKFKSYEPRQSKRTITKPSKYKNYVT